MRPADPTATSAAKEAWESALMAGAEHRIDCGRCTNDRSCVEAGGLALVEQQAWRAYFDARMPALERWLP